MVDILLEERKVEGVDYEDEDEYSNLYFNVMNEIIEMFRGLNFYKDPLEVQPTLYTTDYIDLED